MEGILGGLNQAQKDAVTSPSSILQVLAPPGSGKTKTLTARVAYLLTHHGYAPWDIICCTFTIKAAREMRERLRGLIGEGEAKLILGTFHSICRRYLARYGNKIGIPSGFGIADSADSLAIIKRVIKRNHYNLDPSVARSRISHRKAKGGKHEENHRNKPSPKQQEITLVYADYEKELAKSNLLDYDDLLLKCLELLRKCPECVSNVQAVLIDEFQDTNTVQFELMKLFASARSCITIVGDPDQSIYSFRAAEIENLLHMQKHYQDTTVIHLEENYRSFGAILSCAQNLIEQDTTRPSKRLKATHAYGSRPTFRKLPSAWAEASWIVLEIQRAIALSGKTLNYADFAILLRSASLSRLIESAMGKAGVPYRMVGGFRFFDRIEVRVLLDYLRTISQPQNNDAFLAIINVPARHVGEKTVKNLVEEAHEADIPLFTFIRNAVRDKQKLKNKLTPAARQSLTSLMDMLLEGRELLKTSEPQDAPKALLGFITEKLSYKSYLEKTYRDEEATRWVNVEELLVQAEDVVAVSDSADPEALPLIEGLDQQAISGGEETLSNFLANIALSSEVRSDDNIEQPKITISTIHAAKGLEWPVVFVPSVYQGSIPHSRAEETDEERRLLYVAMTRAQALLYLSLPFKDSRGDGTDCSTFILPDSLLRYFQDSGPVFNDTLVRDVAIALRRDLPSEQVIVEETQKLRSMYDDLWPLDGESGEEDERRWAEKKSDGSGYQQCFSVASTMNQSHSFTMPTEPLGGFTTAGQALQTMASVEEPPALKPSTNTKTAKSSSLAKKLPVPKSAGQSSISSFFGMPKAPAPVQKQLVRVTEVNTQVGEVQRLQSVRETISIPNSRASASVKPAPTFQPVQRPTPKLPEHLAHHRLTPILSTGFKRPRALEETEVNYRRKRHDLQSSSPPPEATDPGQGNQDENDTGDDAVKPTSFGGYRPLEVMQSTTVMSLNQQNGSSTGVVRKTYGVRRSMNGWADRMKRG